MPAIILNLLFQDLNEVGIRWRMDHWILPLVKLEGYLFECSLKLYDTHNLKTSE